MQNKNKMIITGANLRFAGYSLFQIGFVFAEYDLFKTTTFIQNCIYMNFRKNLTQFNINFSIDFL